MEEGGQEDAKEPTLGAWDDAKGLQVATKHQPVGHTDEPEDREEVVMIRKARRSSPSSAAFATAGVGSGGGWAGLRMVTVLSSWICGRSLTDRAAPGVSSADVYGNSNQNSDWETLGHTGPEPTADGDLQGKCVEFGVV
jgi:hypothetical protein